MIGKFFKTFIPTQVSDCQLWLDARDTSTITLETGVREWRDKSGNNRHVAQTTLANQPSYANNTITFDGLNDVLTGDAILGLNYTAFIVSRTFATGGTRTLFSNGDGSKGACFRYNTQRNMVANNVAVVSSFGAFSTTNFEVVSVSRSPTSFQTFVNNVLQTSGGVNSMNEVTAPTAGLLGIGNRPTTIEFLNCSVSEVLFFNRQLTTQEMNNINIYLARKNNIT